MRNVLKVVAVLVVIAAFVMLVLYTKNFINERTTSQNVVSATQELKNMQIVNVGGTYCVPRNGVKNILIIGLDIDDKIVSSKSYNNEYDADFLLLASFDINNKKCSLVEINRDTMADVQRLDIFGQKIDKQKMQLCLSYSFGDGLGTSAMNTKRAVSDLFYGLNIDNYIVLSRDAIRQAVDFFGGVSVTMDRDYLDIDSSYVAGSTHVLDRDSAMKFVTARKETDSGTNLYRMERQMCLLNSVVKELQFSDIDHVGFYNAIVDYTLTDVDLTLFKRIIDEIQMYNVSKVITPSGTTQVDFETNEFYPDAESLKTIAMDVFYDIY